MKTKKIFRGMPTVISPAAIATVLLLRVTGCDNKDYSNASPFDSVVYLDAARLKDVSDFTLSRTIETGQKETSALLARPADEDTNVGIKVDASLVSTYNACLGANYTVLDAKHHKLSADQTIIPRGEVNSKPVTIDFSGLTDLEIDAGYLLPIITDQVSDGTGTLSGSKIIYYVVCRFSAITTTISLKNNFFEVSGFGKGSFTADVINNIKQLTCEAIMCVNSFKNGVTTREISMIMDTEQYCLLRLGDADFPTQQLQFSCNEIKFPSADNSKPLQEGKWYHVVVTFDTEKKVAAICIDGRRQSRIEGYGKGGSINLGMQNHGKGFMFRVGHSYGEPTDFSHQLDGEICEVRVWSVMRTQQEILGNMYNVDPAATGLCAYWKFNEGHGDIAEDYTGHGNNAHVHISPAVRPQGIEVTQRNKE